MSANKASILAVLGASGSGKSTFIKRTISRGHPRLLIWDAMSEYDGAVTAGMGDLLAGLKGKNSVWCSGHRLIRASAPSNLTSFAALLLRLET